jgi:putative chitinase
MVVQRWPVIFGIALTSLMPHLNASLGKVTDYERLLEAAMVGGQITTKLRIAAFLAQLAHESGELRYFEELATGQAYEGRKDLGNSQIGDGPRFKGRGPIQLTGRLNYTRAGEALGLDLVGHPEIAATPGAGFRIAVWYWVTHSLNALADAGDFDGITLRINGALRGKPQRDAYYHRALELL